MKKFELEKWYFDITNDSGEVFIGYAANLKWGKISFGYNGYLLKTIKNQVTSNSSFGKYLEPHHTISTVAWKTAFGNGTWNVKKYRIVETLLHSGAGNIEWDCISPNSLATFEMGGKPISGNGYVEKIKMTLPPWKLPIRQLIWGRYLSEKQSIIWIEWKGPQPKQLLFHNGIKNEHAIIKTSSIQFEDYEMGFYSSISLRSGSIGNTIFSSFKEIMSFFPSRIFNLDEKKWAGRATLKHKGEAIDSGNYIHEIVDWK